MAALSNALLLVFDESGIGSMTIITQRASA